MNSVELRQETGTGSSCLRKTIVTVSAALLLIAGVHTLQAQNRNAGEIRGTVQDATGAAVPEVSIDAKNIDTGVITHAVSNGSGVYDIPYVVPGNYALTFAKAGYGQFTQTNIVLHVETITVDGKLQVGEVNTSIDVSGESDLLQTESSDLNVTLAAQTVTELPNVGGDWRNYTELLPGVATGRYIVGSGGGLASGPYVVINGAQTTQMSYLLDGAVAVTPVASDPLNIAPPLDAIAEVNISTGVFGAESGNGTAIFNVITKGGSSRFHGAVWERLQNDFFQARPYNPAPPPVPIAKNRWNQYGAAIGGPALKDKLFFFVSFQRNPFIQPVIQNVTVPTAAVRGETQAGGAYFDPAIYGIIYDPATSRLDAKGNVVRDPFPGNIIPVNREDPVALKIQKYYPEANQDFATNGNTNYKYVASTPVYIGIYSGRVDYDLSKTNRIYASGLYSPSSYVNPAPAAPSGFFDYRQQVTTKNGQITDAWNFIPSMVNEVRIAASHGDEGWTTPDTGVASTLGLANLPFDVFPHINIGSGSLVPYTVNSDLFGYIDDSIYSFSDSLTWNKGKHTIKAGGEYDRVTAEFGFSQITGGNFNFFGAATGNPAAGAGGTGYADFLLGAVNNWSVFIPAHTRTTSYNVQAYVTDAYKLLPSLTVNYGLRMIFQQGFNEEHNRFSEFVPTLTNPATGTQGAVGYAGLTIPDRIEAGTYLFQPRIGFSYAIKPSWVLRAGFGLYNIPWTTNNYTAGLGNGFSDQNVANPTGITGTAFQLQAGPPSPIPATAANLTPQGFNGQNVPYQPYHTPIAYLTEYQLGVQHEMHGYLIDMAYVGSKGTHIGFNSELTQIPRAQLGASTHPYPQYNSVIAFLNDGESNYNALQVQSKKQFHAGFSYQVSYTFAKNLDTGTGQGGIGVGQETYQDSYSTLANYGPSLNDLRHSLNGSIIYELPFGRGKRFDAHNGLANAIFGGFQVSTAFQSHSGTPFNPTVANSQISGNYSTVANGGGTLFTNRVSRGTLAHPTRTKWFDVDAFLNPLPNTYGNTSRNPLYGPHFNQVDLSAAKTFTVPHLGERTNFQLKADAFNALNHPNLGQPNATVYGVTGGDPAANAAANAANNAGGISSFYPMRNLQLSGIIHF